MLPRLAVFVILFGVGLENVVGGSQSLSIMKNWINEWTECCLGDSPTTCLEKRTIRDLRGFNAVLKQDLGLNEVTSPRRLGKELQEEVKDTEMELLASDNEKVLKEIEKKSGQGRGLLDELGDFIVYVTTKLFNPFSTTEDEGSTEVAPSNKQAIEERGHKKKHLKKQNKVLKIILLLMLFKNKIKMFVSKLQFFVQLKFLGVATINMLANVFRLWLELKKKHKPNKVVFYESAHHQHHYDHEHLDHDDIPYGRPSHYAHFAHHEEDDYGGGPWPWSRSYSDKDKAQTFKKLSPYQYKPDGYGVAYYNQRNIS